MRNGMLGFFMVICCGAFLAGGCAKKELVKGEPITSTTKPAERAPAKPAMPEEAAQPQPTKETAPAPSVQTEPFKEAVQSGTETADLEKIYFDFDSYILTQASRDTLTKNAESLLKKNLSVKIQVEGHCDERGSDEYNLALGEKRAKAALNYLVTLGVPAARLSFISYGEEKPAEPGHDEVAWAKNRRGEFVIIK